MSESESSYVGRHAELYDIMYAEKPYEAEAAFVHHCIQEHNRESRRVLELACGTGTHSLLLEEYGYQLIATDYSKDMLARATAKAQSAKSSVEFRRQDMRTLDIPERPFDAVICLFDSIGYVATNDNIFQVLSGVYDHLAVGGLFIFEFWHAGAMLRGYEPLRIRRWKYPEGEILRISETSIDYARQLCSVSYSIYELGNDSRYHYMQETQLNRFFMIQEMDAFLREAGLISRKWFSGFQEDTNIDDQTWHVVAVAEKPEVLSQ